MKESLSKLRLEDLTTSNPAMARCLQLAALAAKSDVPVVLLGETGTGKTLLAQAIHNSSARAGRPFVAFNASAISDTLLESQLFGHERGAFTGAVERKLGRLEMAGTGTIVLDEVAALSPATQAKLLRVLEERQFERLGSTETITIEARLVALTNSDLARLVSDGQFREDLFFRLSVLTISLPALRERPADILPLADALLDRAARVHGRHGAVLAEPLRRMLEVYSWPGNVRELKNAIERALVFSTAVTLTPDNFPESVRAADAAAGLSLRSLEEIERQAIHATLEATRYKISKSAEILGISRKTLLDKRKKYGLN